VTLKIANTNRKKL